ncbi:MAG: hypothetical protein U9P88_02265 [Patescibacteria group bacterium]|nr:hypothetical protein [Patescibacteria group bacterium]
MKNLIVKQSFNKTLNNFTRVLPIILGTMMLVSLSLVFLNESVYKSVFTGSKIIDPLLGAVFGSVSAGNPITSYIIGGELLKQGVGFLAVTAFIVAWVTVGIVQLPAEAMMLGKRFAIVRNIISFILALFVSILTIVTLNFL